MIQVDKCGICPYGTNTWTNASYASSSDSRCCSNCYQYQWARTEKIVDEFEEEVNKYKKQKACLLKFVNKLSNEANKSFKDRKIYRDISFKTNTLKNDITAFKMMFPKSGYLPERVRWRKKQ